MSAKDKNELNAWAEALINSKEEIESILEGLVYSDDNNKMYFHLDNGATDRGLSKSPYFKICNNKNFSKSSKIARISMTSPNYEYHGSQKLYWKLSNKEKKLLIQNLNKVISDGKTLWELLKEEADNETHNVNSEFILGLEMPDYNLL